MMPSRIMFPDSVRKEDREKFDQMVKQFAKSHTGHNVGYALLPLEGAEFKCEKCGAVHASWYVLSTSCNDCKEIISMSVMNRDAIAELPRLLFKMDDAEARAQAIAKRPPPDLESE